MENNLNVVKVENHMQINYYNINCYYNNFYNFYFDIFIQGKHENMMKVKRSSTWITTNTFYIANEWTTDMSMSIWVWLMRVRWLKLILNFF